MSKKDHKKDHKKDKEPKPLHRIEQVPEPEIQFLIPSQDVEAKIEAWLIERGALEKKQVRDSAIYFDTDDFAFLNDGVEYRIKEKGNHFNHDMKTPSDTNFREVVPDANGILHRIELKVKSETSLPLLKALFGHAILKPFLDRNRDILDKIVAPMFRASFFKHKYDLEAEDPQAKTYARVEYSFQTGHMESLDGTRKTPLLHILELELRDGDEEGLIAERQAVVKEFAAMGLVPLAQRKVLLGFGLLSPTMTEAQKAVYADVCRRNQGAVAAPVAASTPGIREVA